MANIENLVDIKELYPILEGMFNGAIKGDKKRVMDLNQQYEDLVHKVYHENPTKLELTYENCRTSCVMSFTFPIMKAKFLSDAKSRFSEIPDPRINYN